MRDRFKVIGIPDDSRSRHAMRGAHGWGAIPAFAKLMRSHYLNSVSDASGIATREGKRP
jgi:hypothetical protein